MNRLALLALAAATAKFAVWCVTALAEPSATIREQDGIRADISVTAENVLLRWRFVKPLAVPLDDVAATINGRPLGVPIIEPYPAVGQVTAALALLDATDLGRKDDIDRFKVAMVLLATRKAPHDQVAFAVYGLDGHLLAPQGDDPDETLSLLARVPPLEEDANLSGALVSSIRTLEKIAAARRAIYVFTDGHNDGDKALADIAELAHATGTAVTFVVAPSSRTADKTALAQFAEATGGQLIEAKDIGAFLDEPFALLDSGAQVRFPLEGARRFFWESEPDVKIVFRYGEGRFAIAAKALVPTASFGETISYASETYQTAVFAAGGTAVALIGFGLFVRRKRRPVPVIANPAPRATVAAATLEDVEVGATYPLYAPLIRIGRNSDNDIVLQAPTVGRFHAVVQQIGDRAYSITDQSSANGTLVNNKKIDTATLSDGDVIMLGGKKLRFNAT